MYPLPVFTTIASTIIVFGYFAKKRSELSLAWSFGKSYRRDPSQLESGPLEAPESHKGGRILQEMYRFDQASIAAKQSRTLQYFDVGQSLSPIFRAVPTSSGFLRPSAGWFLLVGLILTLWNLQKAVGNLSQAFADISRVSHSAQSIEPQAGNSREQNVTDRMAEMTTTASHAFQISGGFILVALECSFLATLLERRARVVVFEFEQSANAFYRLHLPTQLPVTEGRVAQLLIDSVGGMREVVEELRGAAGAFGNLQPLIESMSATTDTIQNAMQQLPEDLRSSMSNVTTEMVAQLNETLGESAEYTKKILAIYAEQELRVKSLHSIVNSTQSALAEIRSSHQLLEALPTETARIAEAAEAIALNSKEMSIKLSSVPTEALSNASLAISRAETHLHDSSTKLQAAYLNFMTASSGITTIRQEGDA